MNTRTIRTLLEKVLVKDVVNLIMSYYIEDLNKEIQNTLHSLSQPYWKGTNRLKGSFRNLNFEDELSVYIYLNRKTPKNMCNRDCQNHERGLWCQCREFQDDVIRKKLVAIEWKNQRDALK